MSAVFTNGHFQPAPADVLSATILQALDPQRQRLQLYMRLLREHDWTFEASDDSRAYRKGAAERAMLLDLQRQVDVDGKIWRGIAPVGAKL